jgi:hypothetical protein
MTPSAAACGPARRRGSPRRLALLSVAAGLLRRDRMLLTPGSVSWYNHAHEVISTLIYANLVAA